MVVLLSLVPRLLTVGHFTMYDEPVWRRRSSDFIDAVSSGSFGDASAVGSRSRATMPGVTTMWIGSFARGVWASGRSLGLWSNNEVAFTDSPGGLAIAQASMAVVVSVLLGLLTFLVAKWAGSLTAGAIAGVLLATEPFVVGLGAVLHTDELMSFLGVASLLACALVLGLPRPTSWQGRGWAAALAGGLFAGALLTKLSAAPFLVGTAALGAWALWRHLRTDRAQGEDGTADSAPRDSSTANLDVRAIARIGTIWVATAVAVFVVCYPALWVHPLEEIGRLRNSAGLASSGHSQFFLGERTDTPGPAYLFVTLPMRATPWFLVASLAAGVTILQRRSLRCYGLVAVGMALPTFIVVSLASKQGVRYALPVPVVGAIVIGIVGASLMTDLAGRISPRFPVGWLAAAAISLAALHSVAVAPWGNAYFNPILGGGATAERAHLVGSGEGLDVAGDLIRDREADRCDDVLIWTYDIRDAFPCGRLTSQKDNHSRADYVVLYINQRQRQTPALLEALTEDRELLDTVTIRGLVFAEVFGPTEPQDDS